MPKSEYQFKDFNEKITAKALSKNQPISLKYSTEICREIKGKPVKKVLAFLQRIADKEEFLPLRKYRKKVAHRKGEAKSFTKTGRYPVKAAKTFIKLIESAKANAVYKGLDEEKLIVLHAFASQGYSRRKMQPKGRIAGKIRKAKATHIEVVLLEAKGM